MCRAEDAVFKRLRRALQIFAALFAQWPAHGREQRFELAVHPGVELALLLRVSHEAVKDRRFDVRDEHAVQKAERAVADDAVPVHGTAALLLGAGDEIGDHRLVRLLVQLGELRRARMIVPALDARRRKNKFHKPLRDHVRVLLLSQKPSQIL